MITITAFDDPPPVFAETHRVLGPDGHLVIAAFDIGRRGQGTQGAVVADGFHSR